jgi:hypothetical protein
MALLTRTQVKAIVVASLKTVANLPDDVEAATLGNMVAAQQEVFLSALKTNLNNSPYYLDDGSTSDAPNYDIDIMPDTFGKWATVGDCIDWVTQNQSVEFKP